MYYLGYIYAFLFVFVGWFLSVYAGMLIAQPKPFNVDSLFRYVAAILFVIIVFWSIVNLLIGCIPTFGLEERVAVVG